MAHSALATVNISADGSNYTVGREKPIRCITIHHMAGVMSAEQCGNVFAVPRGASAHYGIGVNGEVGVYVEEENTAWANANWGSNSESISIEFSNSSRGGDWPVSDATYKKGIELVADIAKRNGLGKLVAGDNLTWHSMFSATTCPGDYLRARIADIAEQANKINEGGSYIGVPVTAEKKSDDQIADEVIARQWGNGSDRQAKLEQAGYNYNTIQSIVNQKLGYGGSSPVENSAVIKAGDKVTLKQMVDYNGTGLVKTRDYYFVSAISGDRAVLTADNINGPVYAAAKVSNLNKVGGGVTPVPSPTVTGGVQAGDRVTLINWVDYNGTPLIKTRDFYTVSELSGDRAVLTADGAVYAAVNKSNLREV